MLYIRGNETRRYDMKTYNTLKELKADLTDTGDLIIDDDITIRFDVPNDIILNIDCRDIDCRDIDCKDIDCKDIVCWNPVSFYQR